jgi:hypothetical protein
MGSYIAGLVSNLSSVVAEEEYHQEVSSPSRRRDLKSELLLVPYPGANRLWVSFRDVLTVDGEPVHDDRNERLTALFLRPPDAARRAREISAASEKYDIARVTPFDEPFLALSLLQSAYQRRFRFGRLGLDRKLGPRIRILEFEEVQRPSLIRNGINELLISGRVWMDEESGKVHDTEDRIADRFECGSAIRQGWARWASGDCRGYTTGPTRTHGFRSRLPTARCCGPGKSFESKSHRHGRVCAAHEQHGLGWRTG